jgi:hypothetical protein
MRVLLGYVSGDDTWFVNPGLDGKTLRSAGYPVPLAIPLALAGAGLPGRTSTPALMVDFSEQERTTHREELSPESEKNLDGAISLIVNMGAASDLDDGVQNSYGIDVGGGGAFALAPEVNGCPDAGAAAVVGGGCARSVMVEIITLSLGSLSPHLARPTFPTSRFHASMPPTSRIGGLRSAFANGLLLSVEIALISAPSAVFDAVCVGLEAEDEMGGNVGMAKGFSRDSDD